MRFLLGYGSCGIASGADSVLKSLEASFSGTDFCVEKAVENVKTLALFSPISWG